MSDPREPTPPFGSSLLDDPARRVVIQDGEQISAARLRELASRFVGELSKIAPARVAVHAVRADVALAALIAGLETSCEVLLLREVYPVADEFWKTCEVAALFDETLKLRHNWGVGFRPAKPGVLLTTSGTTGKPKVAVHDLDKLLGRVRSDQSGNRWLLSYHPASFAGLQVLLTAFCTRSELVAFAGMTASELVARVLASDVTYLSGTPTFWRSLLLALPVVGQASSLSGGVNEYDPMSPKEGTSHRTGGTPAPLSLRQITLGGEAVDQSILDALRAAFPEARIISIYASTEAGALFAVKDGLAGFPASWLAEGVEGCQLRIVDGVLQVLSPRAMRGYLGDASKRAMTDDGWLITGDVVEVVAGRVLFRGRVDNILNVGGGKVMPEQVETALLEVPVVREARVYGIKNPLAGDVLAADVVLAQAVTEAEARRVIFSALSARLEPYKVPRLYRFVDKISVNAAGKKIRVNP